MAKYILAKNGESDFHIVNHRFCDETVRFAAAELQKYILMATNTVIPYFSDIGICPQRGPEIRLGADVRGKTAWETELHEEGFRICGIRRKGGEIYGGIYLSCRECLLKCTACCISVSRCRVYYR